MTLAEPHACKAHHCSVGKSNHFADTRQKKNGGELAQRRTAGINQGVSCCQETETGPAVIYSTD